jgi:DNA-binding transcriptional ArsR family regulator
MPHAGYEIAKLLLAMTKTAAAVFLHSENHASEADAVMLCAAVYIGQCEKRPMTAGKLSAYIGMPRPTVLRKLGELEQRGLVSANKKKQWCIADNSPKVAARIAAAIDALLPLIHNAEAILSRMDTRRIASKRRQELDRNQSR